MIEVKDLQKSYGDLVAVDRVSFVAKAGTVFGLLGPNGAGKSTTISCISGLLKPTAGSIKVGGFDIASEAVKAKAALGIVPQELAIYEDLSARDNLSYWGAAYGLKGAALKQRVDHILNRIGLTERLASFGHTDCSNNPDRLDRIQTLPVRVGAASRRDYYRASP